MDEHAITRKPEQNRFRRILARLTPAPRRCERTASSKRNAFCGNGPRFRPKRQGGQAILEYLLVLVIAFTFTHQVFFNTKWGFKSVLQKTMLRLGSFLEQNLKSGTKVGGNNGKLSLDPYAGTDRWSN